MTNTKYHLCNYYVIETLGQKWPNLAEENQSAYVYIFRKWNFILFLFYLYLFVWNIRFCFMFFIWYIFFYWIYLDWFEYIERLKLFCKTFLFQYYMFNMQIEKKKKFLSLLNYSSGIFLIFNSNNSYGIKTTTRSQTYIDFFQPSFRF